MRDDAGETLAPDGGRPGLEACVTCGSHACGHQRPVSTEARGLRMTGDRAVLRQGRGAARRGQRSRYEALVTEMKTSYRIAIRKWRTGMQGAAYELKYRDGRIKRLITAPRPRGPVSAAIFLHEVGHHAVGFRRYSNRVLEEFYVWQWAFREMTSRGISVDPRVLRHYRRSMLYYVRAAKHAGAAALPPEVQAFLEWPG